MIITIAIIISSSIIIISILRIINFPFPSCQASSLTCLNRQHQRTNVITTNVELTVRGVHRRCSQMTLHQNTLCAATFVLLMLQHDTAKS